MTPCPLQYQEPPVLPPRIRAIVDEVSQDRGVSFDQMRIKNRERKFVHARWDVWRRIRALDRPPSFPKIGRWFNRDHTTVIHGVYHD